MGKQSTHGERAIDREFVEVYRLIEEQRAILAAAMVRIASLERAIKKVKPAALEFLQDYYEYK